MSPTAAYMREYRRKRREKKIAAGEVVKPIATKKSPVPDPHSYEPIKRYVKREPKLECNLTWRPYQERFLNDPSRRKIWVKSAQIGGSTTLAAFAMGRCLQREKHLVILLSASDRQAKELILKAHAFVRGFRGVESASADSYFANSSLLQHSITFANKSRIIAIPANPETARGYTGDMILDEFAHHPDPAEIFTAAYRQITLGDNSMLITSTPNGQQGKFWEFAHGLDLDRGVRPNRQPVSSGSWSGHWTDIHLAAQEGLQVDIEEIRSGCDSMTWSQEYLCQFLSESELWLSPALLDAAIDREANVGPPAMYRSRLYAGWDVARSQDKSILWFTEILGDISWTRGVVDLSGLDTPTQIEQARLWMPQIERMNIDKSGMGLTIYETLQREYPTKVDGIQFTAAIKEQMSVQMKMRLEQRKMRLPNDDATRRSFLSLRRSVNKIGQTRFDSEHDAKYGHADHYWACAMAEMAAERQTNVERSGPVSNIRFDSQAKGPFSRLATRPL